MAKLQDVGGSVPSDGDGFSLPKYEPIPDGDYSVVVEKGKEDKMAFVTQANGSKKCTAMTVYYTFVVLQGPHAGRKVFDQLGLVHHTESYQSACFARLKAYFKAAGLPDLKAGDDSDDLHGRTFVIRVGTEKGGAKTDKPGEFWPDKNKVLGAFPENPDNAAERQRSDPQPSPPKTKNKPLSFADPAPAAPAAEEYSSTTPDFDDDIPF